MGNKEIIAYARDDGYNPSVKCDNPIVEKWIHKDIVNKTGSGEDDFIIDQKPVKVDEVDIQKSIDEEAKTTDLKYLLKQLLLTGDESFLNKRPGFYGDITGIQNHVDGASRFVSPEDIKASLPEELKSLSVEELAKMSDQDIIGYFNKVREENKVKVEENVIDDKKGEE